MQVNLVSILSIFVMVLYLQIGLFVLWKNPLASLNRFFFFVSLGFAFWSFGHVFYDPAQKDFDGYYLFRIAAVGAFLYLPFLLRFFTLLSDIPRNNAFKLWIFRLSFLAGLLLVYFSLFKEGHIENLFFINRAFSRPEPTVFFISALTYFFVCLSAMFIILLVWRKSMSMPGEIAQFNIIFYPLIVAFLMGLFSDLILPMGAGYGINHLSHIYSVFWLGGVAYGMLRFRFFALTPKLAAEQVVGHANQVLFLCELNGEVTRTNSFTAKLLNLPEKEISGKMVSSFFAEETEIGNFITWTLGHGFSGPTELSLRSAQGKYISVNLSLSLVKDRFEDILGMIIFGQDNREAIRLRNEIIIRKQIEDKLRGLSEVLDARVKERTDQLANSYKELQVKMTERLKVEEKIKSDIVEKEVLINEIHNRVKNNMNLIITLINANISMKNPEKVNRKFRELAQRVRAILLVHHHLYLSMNYSEVDFSGFLKMLVTQLADQYGKQTTVKVELNLSEIFLDMDQAIPLGIIINEVISNSFGHAFNYKGSKVLEDGSWKLTIDFFQKEGYCHLRVSDNGKGLPKLFNLEKTKTNGLPLVQVLVNDQVSGTLEIESKRGTSIKITFPVPEIAKD